MSKIHYAGSLKYKLACGCTVQIRAGYAACCSGYRAHAIRLAGNNTRDAGKVTCKLCRRAVQRARVGVGPGS